jgi:hypothetical protein
MLCWIPLACKEQRMTTKTAFPPVPVEIPFTKGQIVHLFPVLRENSIGLVYGERWAITRIDKTEIQLDNFPENEFSIPTAIALPQKDPDFLYVRTPKSVDLLNWKTKRQEAYFMDISKSLGIGIEISKVVDYQKGITLSVFFHDDEDMEFHYYFVLDDILNKKRLKEIPLPGFSNELPVYFTPSYTIYRPGWHSQWRALDNDLNQTIHPLVDLLNKDTSSAVLAVLNDNMFVSEELRHALIITYNKTARKDMLFLARWYGIPEIVPVPMAINDGERLMKSPNRNTMSPSGRWVYFAVDGGRTRKDTHYLVYLDPKLPSGFLAPFKLDFEGDVDLASWVTVPEGLVLYRNGQLAYYDLSHFDPKQPVEKLNK